ncbi:hypothetical protein PH552_12265 [Rhizobium sp. CNPSo 3968]|uniref:hypothetical protein n=1 Tax=Rhizobium sp. CNPSo 3968 TaxID=3021408 RepID=UPI00254DCD3C|nr:hypothetical protein [Rhizobium sp. CNPSo 3968]MDK4720119.1 hypothetical protein [Rhizobium sp. CNPSo 3968]
MSSTDDDFRKLLQQMIESHKAHIDQVLRLHDKGVTVGAPTINDIVGTEQQAINNLQSTLDQLNSRSR